MSKLEHISEIAEELKTRLPLIVTKEELMNCYIHEINPKGIVAENITVFNLIEAAHVAGKQVKGKSRLEINVSVEDQIQYIKNAIPTLDRVGFKEIMFNNKEEIIRMYEAGANTKDIGKKYGCNYNTVNTYLKLFGVKIRKRGRKPMGFELINSVGISGNSRTKYVEKKHYKKERSLYE